jgi:hypothetical protein
VIAVGETVMLGGGVPTMRVTVTVAREIWNHYRSKGYVQCG